MDLNDQLSKPYSVLGSVHYLKKEYTRAEELYRKAIRADSSDPLHYANLGLALVAQEKFEEGVVNLENAVAMDPSNPVVQYQLSFAYSCARSNELAFQAAKKAAKIQPTIGRAIWLITQWFAIKPIVGIFLYLLVVLLFFVVPTSVSYSMVAIVISVALTLLFLLWMSLLVLSIARSTKIVRYGKPVLMTLYVIISFVYLKSIYAHWTQPIITHENFVIDVETRRLVTENQKQIGRFSLFPPFLIFDPAVTLALDVSVVNELNAPIECLVTDNDSFVRFGSYRQFGGFQVLPGGATENLVIEFAPSETGIWLVCGNNLSYQSVLIELNP